MPGPQRYTKQYQKTIQLSCHWFLSCSYYTHSSASTMERKSVVIIFVHGWAISSKTVVEFPNHLRELDSVVEQSQHSRISRNAWSLHFWLQNWMSFAWHTRLIRPRVLMWVRADRNDNRKSANVILPGRATGKIRPLAQWDVGEFIFYTIATNPSHSGWPQVINSHIRKDCRVSIYLSMGGYLVTDAALFLSQTAPYNHMIIVSAVLAYDTPYYGLCSSIWSDLQMGSLSRLAGNAIGLLHGSAIFLTAGLLAYANTESIEYAKECFDKDAQLARMIGFNSMCMQRKIFFRWYPNIYNGANKISCLGVATTLSINTISGLSI